MGKRDKLTHIDRNAESGGSLLHAVAEAAALLLPACDIDNIDNVLLSSIDIIGNVIDADRIHIWRSTNQADDTLFARLYSWISEYAKNIGEVLDEIDSPFGDFPAWSMKLRRGWSIGGITSAMAPDEQAFFGNLGVKTIYILPLMLDNSLWGVLSISDCRHERSFTEHEESALKAISLMVASAVNRQTMALDLVDANERALAASKAKTAFLSNISHEVRTPLNAIVGMTVVGRNTGKLDEKDYALSKIGDASAHMLEIISNVIDMARIEEGTLEISPSEFIFRDMLVKVVSAVNSLTNEKNQSVKVNVDDDIPESVIGDSLRLSQLILNIVSNAVKFTPAYGKITIDVNMTKETPEHLELQIVVKDNGIGISKDQQDRLFVAFEQAHGSLNRNYGGAGLGLPIAKRIIELMDGSISIESEPNVGTEVFVTVQVAKCAADGTDASDKDVSDCSSLIVPGEFKGKRLLIVEDIEINREILIALLKDSGLIMECAEDGQVALNMVMFNVEKYDIVFMDLQMPNMGGLEATQHIRELPTRKRGRLPIVAMTANVLSEDIKACLDAGMDDHLGKPLDLEKVLDVLRKYLND